MKKIMIIIILFLGHISCVNNRQQPDMANLQSEIVVEVVKVWKVDSLQIPKCRLCDEVEMKVNKLFGGNEVNLGDRFIMNKNKLFHLTSQGDTIGNYHYYMDSNSLTIHGGSDWYDSADIIFFNNKKLILNKSQRIVTKEGDEKPDNNLIVYLTKE